VIAITLVLSSVFIPTAFIPGLTGQFFRQFALTIACSTIISATNALTMAPARAVVWLKPHDPNHEAPREAMPRVAYAVLLGALAYFLLKPHVPLLTETARPLEMWGARAIVVLLGGLVGWFVARPINGLLNVFFGLFNRAFDMFTNAYVRVV